MNRQTKRLMQRQGQVGPDGAPVAQKRQQPRPAPRPTKERTTPAEFFRQVRAELRKVAWPTRPESVNSICQNSPESDWLKGIGAGRYCIRLSRVLIRAVSWARLRLARLACDRLRWDQTGSTGLSSWAYGGSR